MADQWVLLTPTGVDVEVFPGAQVPVPTLVTRSQLLAVANAVAELRKADIEADLGAMLAALARPAQSPGQQALPLEPAAQTAPSDLRTWSCQCGKTWTVATGGETARKAHQATCGLYQDSVLIPTDRRVD